MRWVPSTTCSRAYTRAGRDRAGGEAAPVPLRPLPADMPPRHRPAVFAGDLKLSELREMLSALGVQARALFVSLGARVCFRWIHSAVFGVFKNGLKRLVRCDAAIHHLI